MSSVRQCRWFPQVQVQESVRPTLDSLTIYLSFCCVILSIYLIQVNRLHSLHQFHLFFIVNTGTDNTNYMYSSQYTQVQIIQIICILHSIYTGTDNTNYMYSSQYTQVQIIQIILLYSWKYTALLYSENVGTGKTKYQNKWHVQCISNWIYNHLHNIHQSVPDRIQIIFGSVLCYS